MQLASAETTITLEAKPEAPQLLRLGIAHGPTWTNSAPETLIDHVWMRDPAVRITWKLESTFISQDRKLARFVYTSATPRLRLEWEWSVRATHGPIEHTVRIQNLTDSEIWIPLQASFQFSWQVDPKLEMNRFWVEKGASSPSNEGTHLVPIHDGDEWMGTSSTYAHPAKTEAREIIPYVLVESNDAEESGWYTGIEFSGRTRIALSRHGSLLTGEAGLNPDGGTYKTRLMPGESFETPAIFLGAFKGGPDGAGNILRRWIRETLNHPETLRNPQYPMLVSNSWGSGMAINGEQAHHMMEDAAGLGLEMFHLDAGWFRGLADWTADPAKFPNGIPALSDYAHHLGLKFGLWTDWTQAGISTQAGALNVHDAKVQGWLTVMPALDWHPEEFKGITIDIGLPQARQWAEKLVTKLVADFHLDMLEHDGYLVAQGCERLDHPHAAIEPGTAKRYRDEGFMWVEGSNDTDVSYHSTRAYYAVQAKLRQQFPALLLEVCNDGGRMVDFGSAAHGDYFSITDAYDPVSNRKAFYDASYVLPPAMLETYVAKWPAPKMDNYRYMLRSGMLGWFSLMLDSTSWTPEEHAAARAEFQIYKTRLRPLIREADVYHVTARPDGVHWDGIEYASPGRRQGVLYAFRGSAETEDSHVFVLRGLEDRHSYKVSFQDGSSKNYMASGERLMHAGVKVHLSPNASELVFLD